MSESWKVIWFGQNQGEISDWFSDELSRDLG